MNNLLIKVYRKIVPSFLRRFIYFIRHSIYNNIYLSFLSSFDNFKKYHFKIFLYYFFRIFPIQKNKIFIQSYYGKGYGDNPKYIVENILSHGLNFKLVWAVNPELSKEFPQTIKLVPYNSYRSIYEEVTAKIWIDNCRKQNNVKKRKSQYYIQTWHGILGLKKVEKDVEDKLTLNYINDAKHDSMLADLFISDSKFTSQLYRSSFWYNGDILECGSPRVDILLNQNHDIKNKVRKYFNISEDIKIVLYAPTFRNDYNTDVFNINYELLLKTMERHTNETWIIFIRMHPNISDKSDFIEYNEKIFNASNYDDIQELLIAGDILITDYSSCITEFALMNKPAFLYINDYEQYKNDRDFYFDLFSLPFPCAVNNNELIQNIINFNNESYLHSLNDFFMKVSIVKDGNASQKVVDKIISQTNIK